MKKCPKCKAEIQENARFCIYCMTSFEEKQIIVTQKTNNMWLYIIVAALVCVLIALSITIFIPKSSDPSDEPNYSSFAPPVSGFLSDFTNTNNDSSSEKKQNNPLEKNEASATLSDNHTPNTTINQNDVPDKTSSNTTANNTPSNSSSDKDDTSKKPAESETSGNTDKSDDKSSAPPSSIPSPNESSDSSSGGATNDNVSDNTSSIVSTPPSTQSVTYLYRDAKYGDDFFVGANLENCVVITGVKTVSADGRYEIPERIDGKKVIAIMALAFCDDNISNTVKTVVVPSTVKTIWNNAFANCYNLTHIYFKGNSIYTESNAFAQTSKRNGTLTIHCSANCSDRNYRYYKNSASYYDAEYAEWNG